MVPTMVVTHHNMPVPPVVITKHPPPPGQDPVWDTVIPYIQGLGESIKHTCTMYGIQTYFRGNRTIRQMLVRPKDPDSKEKKSGVIYIYQYGAIDCGEEYIGKTSRTLGERYKEHLREPSNIQVHSQSTGHKLSQDNFNIIGREGQDLTYIMVNNPSLNGNIGKFHLSHIWDRVLFSTPTLK